MITSLNQLDPDKTYTIADYLSWQFQERVELWKGRIAKMAPAPNVRHQLIAGEIYGIVWSHLRKQQTSCKVFNAPFDVFLSKAGVDTVIQPDISVVCDLSQLNKQGCVGPPSLVVEVLSPGNARREMKDKFNLYEQAGVQEYWLVDPIRESIMQYTLNSEGQFTHHRPFVAGDILESLVLPGFKLEVAIIFKQY